MEVDLVSHAHVCVQQIVNMLNWTSLRHGVLSLNIDYEGHIFVLKLEQVSRRCLVVYGLLIDGEGVEKDLKHVIWPIVSKYFIQQLVISVLIFSNCVVKLSQLSDENHAEMLSHVNGVFKMSLILLCRFQNLIDGHPKDLLELLEDFDRRNELGINLILLDLLYLLIFFLS